MTNSPPAAQVFIGSSAEGLKYAKALQAELESGQEFIVHRWDIGTFAPGSITLDALIEMAQKVDFAILVATGEDSVVIRGREMPAVRDNIIFEFGLFVGMLGRERAYWLSVGDAKLPSDLSGLTRLAYKPRPDDDIRQGLNDAVLRAEQVMRTVGRRLDGGLPELQVGVNSTVAMIAKEALSRHPTEDASAEQASASGVRAATDNHAPIAGSLATEHTERMSTALEGEIDWLCSNATSQGWTAAKRNTTQLRLRSPKGKEFTLSRKRPAASRVDLRAFVALLRANGLRVNRALQGAVEDSPFG